MLLTDGFGGFGGIAKFNRDFLEALAGCSLVERVYALPRLIPEAIVDRIPEAIVYDRKAAGGKVAFLRRVLARARFAERVDLVICGHLHLLPAAWLISQTRGARLVLVVHGIEAWSPSPSYLANRLARRVDQVVSVSRISAERFTAWSGVPTSKVFILHNCVDLTKFKPQAPNPILLARYALQSSKVIMTVGRLESRERYKGFDEIIDVMPELLNRIPALKYLIVGDGADRTRLENKARERGVSNAVIFTGRISESEKVDHYNIADAYVMPSSGEGFGIVLIEAAACGVPIIGSAVDGSREALLQGRLGVLVDPAQPRDLIKAITTVLAQPSLRTRSVGVEKFSVDSFRLGVCEWLETDCALE